MQARLYGIAFSHPSLAARLMLEHKGIEHEVVNLPAGVQAAWMRLKGFRGGTVPCLEIAGRKVAGSTAIARALESVQPEPPLYPADPALRARVEEAEAWGDQVLQPIPRRLFRHALRHDPEARLAFGRRISSRRPELAAAVVWPVAAFYARREEAGSLERIREDWRALPSHLDHVDALIADGVLAQEQLNAADFQIGTSLRVLLASEDCAKVVHHRPCEALAHRVLPDYRFRMPPVRALSSS